MSALKDVGAKITVIIFVQYLLLIAFQSLLITCWQKDIHLDSSTGVLQAKALTLLGGFSYVGQTNLSIFSVLYLLISVPLVSYWLGIRDKASLGEYLKSLVLFFSFVNLFYFVFLSKYAPLFFESAFTVLSTFFAIFLSLLILECIAVSRLVNARQRQLPVLNSKKSINTSKLIYFCPFCSSKYYSNVKYCLNCKKEITVREKHR